MLYYSNVGFELKALETADSTQLGNWKAYSENKVYSSIKADSVKVYPDEFGRRYFFTANVMEIDRDGPIKLLVTPYTMVNGAVKYGETYVINADFTEESMNKWTYELEKADRSAFADDTETVVSE